jgi:hypothetical protein
VSFVWLPSPATGQRLGSEFMPPLYEGAILYMPTSPPGLSITEARRALQVQDRLLKEFPEVERVFGTAGRGTTATDNSPMGMVNTTIVLKPREAWRPGMTFERLQSEMDEALQFPGFPNVWTQPIRSRLDMLSTGIKTPVGIKILGDDLEVIGQIGQQIERLLAGLPGTRSVYAERVSEGYFTDIEIDRDAIARHGLMIEDVQDVVQSAIGGETVTWTVEGRERYPVNVRYQQAFRDDLPALERVLVRTPRGAQIPLGDLASITLATGPAMVRNEDGLLAGYIYVDTASRDLGGYVDRARALLDERLTLPPGYTLGWTGQYEYQVRAKERLQILIPVVFFVIFMLLFLTFRSVAEAVLVMLSVLYAMTGGVLLQWWLGYNFSVAVWVGYIALYGIAVETGVVMVVYLHEALDKRLRAARPARGAGGQRGEAAPPSESERGWGPASAEKGGDDGHQKTLSRSVPDGTQVPRAPVVRLQASRRQVPHAGQRVRVAADGTEKATADRVDGASARLGAGVHRRDQGRSGPTSQAASQAAASGPSARRGFPGRVLRATGQALRHSQHRHGGGPHQGPEAALRRSPRQGAGGRGCHQPVQERVGLRPTSREVDPSSGACRSACRDPLGPGTEAVPHRQVAVPSLRGATESQG